MGVYIKGMDMPKSCAECRWSALTASATNTYLPILCDVFPKLEEQPIDYEIHTTHSCMMAYKTIDEKTVLSKRADFCPLVEVEEVKGYAGYGTPNQRNVTILCVPNTTRVIEAED